jgi:hypothetical protein
MITSGCGADGVASTTERFEPGHSYRFIKKLRRLGFRADILSPGQPRRQPPISMMNSGSHVPVWGGERGGDDPKHGDCP